MIATICLNACLDRMVEIDSFQYGGMNRIRSVRQDGSGKGINVALAAAELGMKAVCIGFLPEEGGEPVTNRLIEGKCEGSFLCVPGALRVNTKILDCEKGIVTELNEAGPSVTAAHLNDILNKIDAWKTNGASVFVMTGSLPPGCPVDFYARLIERADAPCVLDAEGEKLVRGLSAKPFLIKPNDYELSLAVGKKLETIDDVLLAARELIGKGAGITAVSMGANGALIVDKGEAYYAPRVAVDVKSTVGAGDCMVAGMLFAIEQKLSLRDILRYGVAAGTAGCMTEGTRLLRREDFFEVLDKVEVMGAGT